MNKQRRTISLTVNASTWERVQEIALAAGYATPEQLAAELLERGTHVMAETVMRAKAGL